ncbi:UDP-phosphate alpha-N-acetyl-D-fucosaminephosphotransferase [Leucobacter aridicollis]|uniref:UDP-phosphate alpha-N-acetyl-D-fucosaminephosphotransferase n=1 Tax=Leucobacter aridicollis TaxID=283878 RepID=UPI0021082830|nr:UDP-phosphate alpha-N-acetyl-D-fucosaminephosphotransferase [Leucobacter aridicollis]UTX52508.1 UDP-phosphate alpha-N-acetyl-D-fucosaminephosphotransferase [Leucobacter aridicollis]
MNISGLAFGAAFTLSVLLPFAVRPLLVKLGIVDVPNHRSSHERPVLRGLGLAVLIAVVAVEACFTWLAFSLEPAGADWRFLLTVTLATLAAGLLGLSEDIRGLSVPIRSAVLLAIAAGSALALLVLARATDRGAVQGIDAATLPVWALAALFVYAVLFISSYINVANFMDGLNGISGLHGLIAGLAFAAAGWLSGQHWLVIAGLVLAAGWAGFLPWNLTKPGAFPGDVGSYMLGGAVAVTSFAALLTGVPVLATIGPMVIYFGDVGTTLVKRVRAGHKWDEPHKEHAYQRLQQLGMPHLAASGINAGFTLAASALGLASFFVEPIWWLVLLALGLALVVAYQLMPRLLANKFPA